MSLATLLLFFVLPAQADGILDPTTWQSPSGEFELAVDPSRADGGGPATYSLKRMGVEVWSAEEPFTLWRVSLTDDGVTIGYAYTDGIRSARGELQAIRIDELGKASILRSTPRHSPKACHGAPWPVAHQILLQTDTDRGAIGVDGTFWYLRISSGEQLPPFRFDGDRSSWKESKSTPLSSKAVPEFPLPPPIALPMLGSFMFDRQPTSESEIRDVHDFCIDDRGRFGWVRLTEDRAAWELVLFEEQGPLAARLDLGDLRHAGESRGSSRPRVVWLEKDSWLVTAYEPGPTATWPSRGSGTIEHKEPGRSFGWLVDVRTGAVREGQAFRCPEIWDMAAPRGGGVVALVNRREQYTSESTVIGFDREARPIWTIEATSDASDRSRLFAPKSLAATSDGRIAVIDGVRKILQWFDRGGRFVRAIDLSDAWEDPPGWLDWLSPDGDGGLIVGENSRSRRVRRIGPAGEVCSSFVPRRPDGRILPGNPVVRAPDGQLWTYEEDNLLRLSEDGVVDLALAEPVRMESLGKLGAVEVDFAGRIYAQDQSSHVVHVFGPDGTPLVRCTPEPTDFERPPIPGQLSAGPDGSIYLRSRDRRALGEGVRFLTFAPGGERLGWKTLNLDWATEEWRFGPVAGEWWVVGYDTLFLLDRDGSLKRKIERQPDRRWFRTLDEAAVAPDGSAAVLSTPRWGNQEVGCAVHIYDREGQPLGSVDLPCDVRTWHPCLVWTGRWLFVARNRGGFHVIDSATGNRRTFRPEGLGTDLCFRPFLSAQGRELWLVDQEAKRVLRYSLPAN